MYDLFVDGYFNVRDDDEADEVDPDFEAEIAMNNYEGDNSSGYLED